MARAVVGIYATAAPASWGPWRDRPSLIVPAALGAAVRRAGAVVVVLAPDATLDCRELLHALDAVIVFAGAEQLHALSDAARDAGLALLVLDPARVSPDSSLEDYAREIAPLFPAA